MNQLGMLAAVGMMLGIGSATQASTILELSFNNDQTVTTGTADNPYTMAPGDIAPAGMTTLRIDGATGIAPAIVATPGTDNYGLQLSGHGGWDNYNGGYKITSDHRLTFGDHPEYGYFPDPTTKATGLTLDAVVKFNAASDGYILGKSGRSTWTDAYGYLKQNMWTGNQLQFTMALGTDMEKTITWNDSALIGDGLFHHIQGVFSYAEPTSTWSGGTPGVGTETLTPTGDSVVSLYVDGELKGSISYLETRKNYQMTLNGAGIGNGANFWPTVTFNGVIDSVAIYNAPVSVVPEPATLALLVCGGLMIAGRRKR